MGSSGVRQSATGRRRSSSDVAHGRSVIININALIVLQAFVVRKRTTTGFLLLVIIIMIDSCGGLQLATLQSVAFACSLCVHFTTTTYIQEVMMSGWRRGRRFLLFQIPEDFLLLRRESLSLFKAVSFSVLRTYIYRHDLNLRLSEPLS